MVPVWPVTVREGATMEEERNEPELRRASSLLSTVMLRKSRA